MRWFATQIGEKTLQVVALLEESGAFVVGELEAIGVFESAVVGGFGVLKIVEFATRVFGVEGDFAKLHPQREFCSDEVDGCSRGIDLKGWRDHRK